MSAGTEIITAAGLTKIRDAAGSVAQVAIAHVAIGDGGGSAYDPTPSQTALRGETNRVAIERQYAVGTDAWYVTATVPKTAAPSVIREMGFFDSTGTLIAVWAGANVGDNRRAGAVDYVIQYILAFTGITSGVVTIDAPLDDVIDHALVQLTTDAIIIDRQLALTAQLRGLSQ